MSFALYGPVATFTKTYTAENEVNIHLAGDKILLYLEGLSRFGLYTLTFSEIALLKSTRDFSRIYKLVVHRYGKVPEIYSGYGDTMSPRCTMPYGTCASEMERYTYGSSTTEMLCPYENCEEGNVYDIFYDAVTGKILAGTAGNGNKLYIVDPDTKTFTKWRVRDAATSSHCQTRLYIYDDNTIYVVIKKRPPESGPLEIRKYSVSDFYQYFGTGVVEDYGERVYYEASSGKILNDRGIVSDFPASKSIFFYDHSTQNRLKFSLTSYTFTTTQHRERSAFMYYVLHVSGSYINVVDSSTDSVVQSVPLPSGLSPCIGCCCVQNDHPFIPLCDSTKIYIYLLTYNGKAPVIQYDHTARKIRIVDYITGSVIPGELWVVKSRFCYQRDALPVGITPSVLTVSDWTPIPSATKSECLTFAIKSISA